MAEFKDNLPLDGQVHIKGRDGIFLYRGYRAGNPQKCAVQAPGASSSMWVDRKVLIPKEDGR